MGVFGGGEWIVSTYSFNIFERFMSLNYKVIHIERDMVA